MSVVDYATYFQDAWGAQIVPLWGIQVGPAGSACRCRDEALCDRPGKHATRKWKDAPSRLPGRYDNYGIVTDRLVIIDFDNMESVFPYELPATYTVATAKGLHYYYSTERRVATRLGYVEGIDVKSSGGFVVGPGSTTIKGGTYEPINEFPITPLPTEILSTLSAPKEHILRSGTIPETTHHYAALAAGPYIETMRTTSSGRNNQLFKLAIRMLDFGVGKDMIGQLAIAAIESGLSPAEVQRTIESAVVSLYGAA